MGVEGQPCYKQADTGTVALSLPWKKNKKHNSEQEFIHYQRLWESISHISSVQVEHRTSS